jgi:hypothetical protein
VIVEKYSRWIGQTKWKLTLFTWRNYWNAPFYLFVKTLMILLGYSVPPSLNTIINLWQLAPSLPDLEVNCISTRQTSTFTKHGKYLSILIQQRVVFLMSSQTEISSRCLFDTYLMSIFFDLILVSWSKEIKVKKSSNRWL